MFIGLSTRLVARPSSSAAPDDTAIWAAAVTANGGTVSAGTLTAVTNFCTSAKASGYWTKLNRLNLYCGNQLAACAVPLKVGGGASVDTMTNFIGADYTEATGLTGNGTTKFVRTGLIPSASLTLNDIAMGVYNRSSTAAGGGLHIGATQGVGQSLSLYGPFTDGIVYSANCSESNALISGVIATPFGFLIGSRISNVDHKSYRNGTQIASQAVTGGARPTIELYVHARNTSGAATEWTSHPLGGYFIGSGLTAGDVTAFNTHMQTFQTALGRNV